MSADEDQTVIFWLNILGMYISSVFC